MINLIRKTASRLIAPFITATLLCGLATATPIAKITVSQRGLYSVSAAEIHALGTLPGDLDVNRIGITDLGQRIASQVIDQNADGLFNQADRIVFFGQRLRGRNVYRNRHTDTNTYLFEVWPEGDVPEVQPRPVWLGPLTALPSSGEPTIQRRAHFEDDRVFDDRFHTSVEMETDFTYYTSLDLIRGVQRDMIFNLQSINPRSDSTFTLRVMLFGRTTGASSIIGIADHSVVISINGNEVGREEFDGVGAHEVTLTNLDMDLLQRGENTLSLALVEREGVVVDTVFLDWFEVQYPIPSIMLSDSGEFCLTGDSGSREWEIGGLSSSDAVLFCITSESMLEPQVNRDIAGMSNLVFTAPVDEGLYAVSTVSNLTAPDRIEPYDPALPLNPESGVDMMIITHHNFREQADRLAEHRRNHSGLSVMVVDIQDIYDRFNGGVAHPDAIQRCLRHITAEWPAPTLRYVTLMGDASWDWHQVSTTLETFIPTIFVHNPRTEYASDAMFAMFEPNGIPQVAIGRLPVKTTQEANDVVNKLIEFDLALERPESDANSDWRHRLLFTASDNDRYRNFLETAISDHMEGRFEILRGYSRDESPLDCTQYIVDSVNDGVSFLAYVGHGARYIWQTGTTLARRSIDYEANFSPETVDYLMNPNALPLVFGITCFTNNFDNPSPRNCIGEKLVLSPHGGAIAVIATSSFSFVGTDMQFCSALFETMFENNPERIGDLYLDAVNSRRANVEARRMFLILGDPASPLPLSPLPEN